MKKCGTCTILGTSSTSTVVIEPQTLVIAWQTSALNINAGLMELRYKSRNVLDLEQFVVSSVCCLHVNVLWQSLKNPIFESPISGKISISQIRLRLRTSGEIYQNGNAFWSGNGENWVCCRSVLLFANSVCIRQSSQGFQSQMSYILCHSHRGSSSLCSYDSAAFDGRNTQLNDQEQ